MYDNPITLYELAKMRHQALLAKADQRRLQAITRNSQPAWPRNHKLALALGAITLSLVTYLIPIVATVLGVVVLNEHLGWNAYLGCILIVLGIIIVNDGFKIIKRRQLTDASIRP